MSEMSDPISTAQPHGGLSSPSSPVMPPASAAPADETPSEEPKGAARKRNPKVQMSKVPYGPLNLPMGYDEICALLPHRYPFLLVDKILELEPGVRCVGVKNVTADEDFVQGHFPGYPIMPGVLLLEAMAQVAGVLTQVSRNTPGAISYFAAIENARFRQPVRPGDQLVTEATFDVLRGPLGKLHVTGRVDGETVVEADCTFFTASDPNVVSAINAGKSGPRPPLAAAPAADSPATIAAPSAAPATPATPAAPPEAPAAPAPAPTAPVPAPPSAPAYTNGSAPVAEPGVSNGSASTSIPSVAPASAAPSNRTPLDIPRSHSGATFIHPTALVDPGARLEEGVWVGPFCLIEGDVEIGAETILESHVAVKSGTRIGRRCRVFSHSVLGGDPQDGKYKGERSFLTLGDDNIVREMVTIHRATGEGAATTIGSSNLLMAYVHIGHNCTIGSGNLISNSAGISGHITIEDKVVIGGFVGIHQFAHIGKMAMIGGFSKVVQDVPPFCMADGRPAKTRALNIRGLRRNGVSPEQRSQVAMAVRLLYRSNLNTTDALARIRAEIPASEPLDYLVNFIERVGEGRLGRQDETPHL